MRKRNVVNLIRYFSEGNTNAFRDEAYQIAVDFNESGDSQLGNYILTLLSDKNTFIPQSIESNSSFFKKLNCETDSLPLPDVIKDDLIGIVNAISHKAGINKFLFSGVPGSGKTESAKQLARILNRELFLIDFDSLIDAKLGQTSKNIAALFDEINNIDYPERIIFLFDEIDAIALDRIDSKDLREMGRATSSILKGFDSLNQNAIIIATTNLIKSFDKALLRRFDGIIDFNRYSKEDLFEVAVTIMEEQLTKFKFAGRNINLFKKIINSMDSIPYPGDLKNMIKTAIAFSDLNNEFDYLKRLFNLIHPEIKDNLSEMKKMGFTVREIGILTNNSKSKVSRDLAGD